MRKENPVLKFIHFSDTHVIPRGSRLHGLDSCARLEALVEDVNRNHADADMAIVTGDLANTGQRNEYQELRSILGKLSIPSHMILGNHDDRVNFSAVFPEMPRDESGFVQQSIVTSAGVFVLIDTKEASISSTAAGGSNWGVIDEKREQWLVRQLDKYRDKPVYLFLHHPPFAIGMPALDQEDNVLKRAHRLAAVLNGRPNIRHMFLGHVHRPVTGSWRGIPYSAVRGTNHQIMLDMKTQVTNGSHLPLPVPKNHEPPSYAVVLLSADTTAVHYHDFLDETHRLFVLAPNEHGLMKYTYRPQ